MAKQTINIGTTANDGTGDPLRTAFDKVNDNFTELYSDDAGDVGSIIAGSGITVDQATGDVTVTNASPNATHTGDVTGSTALTIAADAVDGTKIADDSIDSEHYVDGSIDTAHFSLTAAINTVTDQNTGTLKLWSGSQASYDALTPDSSTIYFIV